MTQIKKEFLIKFAKYILSIVIIFLTIRGLYANGLNDYYQYNTIEKNNKSDAVNEEICSKDSIVQQTFFAQGDLLSDVKVFIEIPSNNVNNALIVEVSEIQGKVLSRTETQLADITSKEWYTISLNTSNLKVGKEYRLAIYLRDASDYINVFLSNPKETILNTCIIGEKQMQDKLAMGLTFSYKYMPLPMLTELIMRILITLAFSIFLIYILWNLESLYREFILAEEKKGLSTAVLMAIFMILQYNPLNEGKTQVKEFKRVFGNGFISNFDSNQVIINFNGWFIIFLVAMGCFALLMHHIRSKSYSKEEEEAWNNFDKLLPVAYVSLIFRSIMYFSDQAVGNSVFRYSTSIISLFMIFNVTYVIMRFSRKINYNMYSRLFYILMGISYPVAIFFTVEWGAGRFLFGINVLFSILLVVFIGVNKSSNINKLINKNMLDSMTIIFCFIPLITSIYIELTNILNQYNIFVVHAKRYYFILLFLLVLATILLAFVFSSTKIYIVDWKRIIYPELLFGISLISVQFPLSQTINVDLFEDANHGILISELLNYGKIPIVSHYGGHMLQNVLSGILYGWINNDAISTVTPYATFIIPILILIFYYFIKNLIDEDYAFWISLVIPFYNYWLYFGMGIIVCLSVIRFSKKQTYANALFIWLSCVWCVFYRLDLGVAFSIAAVVSLLIYIFLKKQWNAVQKLLSMFILVAGIIVISALIICLWNNINPLNRLREFVEISSSNQNWGFDNIGDIQKTVFSWAYIFVPLIVIFGLFYTIINKSFRNKIGNTRLLILLILGVSYIVNFPRSLVRHSLAEMATNLIFWTAYIFISIFLFCYFNNKKFFILLFSGFMLLNNLFVQDENFTDLSVADLSSNNLGPFVESWVPGKFASENTIARQKAKRIIWSEDSKDEIIPIVAMGKLLLNDNETYLDFSNKTLLYSIMGKESPVYVSQSPGQLSGEFTQEQFIKEIKDNFDNVPIAILPNTVEGKLFDLELDNIANTTRYYKVSEFIFQNYRPLCSINDVAIWCQNSRYEEYMKLLQEEEQLNEITETAFESINLNNCEISINESSETDGALQELIIRSKGTDPYITDFQNLFNKKYFVDQKIKIKISYKSTVPGIMKLYYTNGENKDFNEENSLSSEIGTEGVAEFSIRVSDSTRLRLDIPDESVITISSIDVYQGGYTLIDWGYDSPTMEFNNENKEVLNYTEYLHSYPLKQLPYLWAKYDKKKAINNKIVSEVKRNKEGIYEFVAPGQLAEEDGNYLLLACNYSMADRSKRKDNDESHEGIIKLGTYKNGYFLEKYQYKFLQEEGYNEYLFRISSDYYWYTDEINAVIFSGEGQTNNVTMKVLGGD